MARISVVIPLYNHEKYIEETLHSVARQTSPADEVILLDDGSSDRGLEIARKAMQNFPIAQVIAQINIGAHATINKLFDVATGDYIAVLNSDDIFHHGKIARCRALITQYSAVDVIVGEADIIDEKGRIQDHGVAADWMKRALAVRDAHGLPQLSLLHENWVATTSNMVIAKSFWRQAGSFRDLRYCHDLDFLMTAFTRGRVVVDHGFKHIKYRVHPRNTIGEDLSNIRLEIAAVWANALYECGSRLVGGDLANGVSAFFDALESKGMSNLICLLQTLRSSAPSAAVFYDVVLRGTLRQTLLGHLR